MSKRRSWGPENAPGPRSLFSSVASPDVGERAPENREMLLDLVLPVVDVGLGDIRGHKLQPRTPGSALLVSVLQLHVLDT